MLQSNKKHILTEVIDVHIAQVAYLGPPSIGGVESHVLELSRALQKHGHTVTIHCAKLYDLQGNPFPQTKDHDKIPTKRYFARALKRTRIYAQPIHFPGIFWGLVKTRPDVVHVHSMASQHLDLCYLYARLFHVPLIVTGHYSAADLMRLHTKRKNGKKPLRLIYWQKRMKKIMRYAALIAITEKEAFYYHKLFGFENITVIPNGIDPAEFTPHKEKNDFLLFAGRIVPEKRIEFLFSAMEYLNPKTQLVIAGYAPDPNYLEMLRKKAPTKVIFIKPSRKELLDLFQRARAFVLPSKNEAFGIVLLEAMASGTVVLASDSGGFPEVIGDCGLLFHPDKPRDLAEKIRLLDDPKLLKSFQEKGLERAQKYNWYHLAEKLLEVYSNPRK